MRDFLDLLHRHRSIRRFTDDPVSDDDMRAAVAAGQAASTSSAVQSYCVIRVTDPGERERLVTLTGGQAKVAASGAFLVICGDTRRHRLLVERAGDRYDAHFEAFLLAVIDASLFAQNLVLAFEALGYGICYIGGLRNELETTDRLLAIPEGVYPLYGLCVGRPAETPSARPRLPVEAVYFEGRYGDDASVLAAIDAYDASYETYLRERGVDDAAARTWGRTMAGKFATPERAGLAAYYRSKGADFS